MNLKEVVNFTNILKATCLHENINASFSVLTIFEFVFFVKRILAEKMLVKMQVSISSTLNLRIFRTNVVLAAFL